MTIIASNEKKGKKNFTKWIVRGAVTVVFIILIGCIIGCSTVRGIINGVESVGAGMLMDARGAINGVDDIDARTCTFDTHNGS